MSKRLREWRLSRAQARAEKSPSTDEKFAKQAHDLDALRKTVEDASTVSAGFWLSYLFVLFYIGIAAGAVTHRDLLLENPVKLPFLNVELPLVAFFALAPILFIISHAYTLVHFVMLGAKVGVYDAELRAQLGDAPETRDGLRRQLPSNIFVQFLAGPRDIRDGGLGWLLKAVAWISLVIGPVLLLLLIQVQFLPYHLEWVTWVQRFAVLVDVILLWALWPAVLNSRSTIQWPRLWRHPVATLASLMPLGLAFTAATFPGEWMDEHVGNKQWIPPNGVTAWLGAKDKQDNPISTSFHDLLFNGDVDDVTRRRKSFFSNTLVLPGFNAVEAAKIGDPKKLDSVKQTLVLRGRHLESAAFDGADLHKADLTGAQLHGVSLNRAQLQGAALNSAELQGASLWRARLQGATLTGAKLQGVDFQGSTFAGMNMIDAVVWRTSFDDASMTAVFEDGVEESSISKGDYAALKAMVITEVPEGKYREAALKDIEKSNPDIFGPEASEQKTLEKGRVNEIAYQNALADQLKSLACSRDESAPYIVRGIIANDRFKDTGAQAPGLVEAILKPDCPVSAALTDADKAALKKLAKDMQPSESHK
jgi:Pentapeptide repeats (8 copies)